MSTGRGRLCNHIEIYFLHGSLMPCLRMCSATPFHLPQLMLAMLSQSVMIDVLHSLIGERRIQRHNLVNDAQLSTGDATQKETPSTSDDWTWLNNAATSSTHPQQEHGLSRGTRWTVKGSLFGGEFNCTFTTKLSPHQLVHFEVTVGLRPSCVHSSKRSRSTHSCL